MLSERQLIRLFLGVALVSVREQPSQLTVDRTPRVMAGEGPPSTTLLLATSKDVGGRPSPAMTRKLQRGHLEDLFPDGHLGDAQK